MKDLEALGVVLSGSKRKQLDGNIFSRSTLQLLILYVPIMEIQTFWRQGCQRFLRTTYNPSSRGQG